MARQHNRFSAAIHCTEDLIHVGLQCDLLNWRAVVAVSRQIRRKHSVATLLQLLGDSIPDPSTMPGSMYKDEGAHVVPFHLTDFVEWPRPRTHGFHSHS